MTPCRTEKVDFSQKKIKHKKTTRQEEPPEKTKEELKKKTNKQTKNCIYLSFCSSVCFLFFWFACCFPFVSSCFFLDVGFLVCFFLGLL